VQRHTSAVREHPPVGVIAENTQAHMLGEHLHHAVRHAHSPRTADLGRPDVHAADGCDLDLSLDVYLRTHEVDV
jgi:hypothetical protein